MTFHIGVQYVVKSRQSGVKVLVMTAHNLHDIGLLRKLARFDVRIYRKPRLRLRKLPNPPVAKALAA